MGLNDDSSAVKIAVREGPLRAIHGLNPKSAISYLSDSSNILLVGGRPFNFNYVFRPNSTQVEVFESLVKPLVEKSLKGFNCTALAYGQTGTGKTFSMGLNPDSFEGDNVGVIPRCLQEIFDAADIENATKEMSASFIEIYNEKVYDLLGNDPNEAINVKGCKFTGGTKKAISNIQEGHNLLNQGNKNRHVRPTKMNTQSSRSHAVFTIHIRDQLNGNVITSCLNLVDLAGSEGVRKTGHQGAALTEGVHINQGLLSIGKVMQAMATGSNVIPYRDSILTNALQDSLNTNSFLALLACISPHREDSSETLSTLRFAQNASFLKITPEINTRILEFKKNRVGTPTKVNPLKARNNPPTPLQKKTPLKHGFNSLSTIKRPPVHSNTFCTPNKVKPVHSKRINQSDIGLTPKELSKATFNRPAIPNRFSMARSHDDSLDSRASLASLMNASTSTAIDVPVTHSYSPIVRECMAKVENSMENTIMRIFRRMQSVDCAPSTVTAASNIEIETPRSDKNQDNSNAIPWDSFKNDIRTIVRQEFISLTEKGASPELDEVNATIREAEMSHLRCQLFSDGSPSFKIPDIPAQIPIGKTDSSLTADTNSSQEDDDFNQMGNQTVIPNAKRRSRRLSSIAKSRQAIPMPIRRSLRLSVSIAPKSDVTLRRSMRNSCAIMEQNETSETMDARSKPKAANRRVPINNKIIAGYFKDTKSKTPSKTGAKNAKIQHQKAILDLLNNGSMKELQILPQIGLKSAYQLLTHRTLNGKFRTLEHVSKVPVWRGKSWDRFKKANNLD